MTIESGTKNMIQTRRWANMALIGIVFYIILDVVIQMLPPHYSLRQAESDLAVGPYGWIMNINFVVRGLLSAAIILAIYKSMKNIVRPTVGMVFFAIWSAASFLLAFFNTDVPNASLVVSNPTYHGELHLVLALIGFICAPIGMLIISIAFRKEDRLKSLSTPTLIISILAVLAFLYLGLRGVHARNFGINERIFIGLVLIWIAVVASKLRRLHTEENRMIKTDLHQVKG
jgi:hypothetical membrane protein